MNAHEMQLPQNDEGKTREKIEAMQALFLKLNSQGEAGIIAAYQTAKSLEIKPRDYGELGHLRNILKAAEARMLALVIACPEEEEKRRLTDTFQAVLDNPWFAEEIWDRLKYEKRAQTRKEFWDKVFSFLGRKKQES